MNQRRVTEGLRHMNYLSVDLNNENNLTDKTQMLQVMMSRRIDQNQNNKHR